MKSYTTRPKAQPKTSRMSRADLEVALVEARSELRDLRRRVVEDLRRVHGDEMISSAYALFDGEVRWLSQEQCDPDAYYDWRGAIAAGLVGDFLARFGGAR
jgi:hypothetical protein